MALTFKKSDLLARAEQAVADHQAAADEYDRRKAAFVERKRQDWLRDERDRVVKYRDWLTKQIKSGGVIADTAAPTHKLWTPPSDWVLSHEQTVKKPAGFDPTRQQEFQALIDMLKATDGETVTNTQLRAMGFSKLSPLFGAPVVDTKSSRRF